MLFHNLFISFSSSSKLSKSHFFIPNNNIVLNIANILISILLVFSNSNSKLLSNLSGLAIAIALALALALALVGSNSFLITSICLIISFIIINHANSML